MPARRTGAVGLLLSEWTKIRSVRSTPWTLLIFVVVSLGLTALFTWLTLQSLNNGRNGARDSGILTDPVTFILGTGLGLGQLAICVLGALVITSEYSSGTIRASLLAVPRRYPVMLAKALVFAVLVFVVGEIVVFCAFFIGAMLVNGETFTVTGRVAGHAVTAHRTLSVSLSQPGVLRAVFGSGLYLTVLGLFALAIGGLIRHTAGAITAVIGMVLVIFPLAGLLPDSWGAHIHAYLPTVAGQLITQDKPTAGQLLSAWQGFGVFCAWTVLLLAAATFLLLQRDA
ncbi:MAG: ABC transporter permease [Actinobacteria bacterium]|nr:ABC transporter permease [Actinomycetota bacterium]